jgi:hypothetical protein
MEQHPESVHDSDSLNHIPTDLEPMYLLSKQDYVIMVNSLTNTVISAVKSLQDEGNEDGACLLAVRAHDILLDYDEDIADHVLRLSGVYDKVVEVEDSHAVDW